jgi:RimJ/RimL family protein N-acetyltransferase
MYAGAIPSQFTDMKPIDIRRVRLRAIAQDDLPWMFEFNLDPEANRLAATIPRTAAVFSAHWDKVLADSNIVAKAIIIDDLPTGYISCFQRDGISCVGYWVGREFWGQGIASRALELLLNEVAIRPLHAHVATSNRASLRVLEKCGFVVRSVQVTPADDRLLECEEAFLALE